MLLELQADIPSTKEIQEVLGNDGTDKVHLKTLVDNMTILKYYYILLDIGGQYDNIEILLGPSIGGQGLGCRTAQPLETASGDIHLAGGVLCSFLGSFF